ncbi:MAG: hypothetical protein JWN57_2305, partial [Frankiales bacterium]|nr:hypothetical protein [Frankiales bacterium]
DGDVPLLVLPVVGDLSRFSRGQRAGLALGAVAALLVPLALLTLVLTGRPKEPSSTVPTLPPGAASPLPSVESTPAPLPS